MQNKDAYENLPVNLKDLLEDSPKKLGSKIALQGNMSNSKGSCFIVCGTNLKISIWTDLAALSKEPPEDYSKEYRKMKNKEEGVDFSKIVGSGVPRKLPSSHFNDDAHVEDVNWMQSSTDSRSNCRFELIADGHFDPLFHHYDHFPATWWNPSFSVVTCENYNVGFQPVPTSYGKYRNGVSQIDEFYVDMGAVPHIYVQEGCMMNCGQWKRQVAF